MSEVLEIGKKRYPTAVEREGASVQMAGILYDDGFAYGSHIPMVIEDRNRAGVPNGNVYMYQSSWSDAMVPELAPLGYVPGGDTEMYGYSWQRRKLPGAVYISPYEAQGARLPLADGRNTVIRMRDHLNDHPPLLGESLGQWVYNSMALEPSSKPSIVLARVGAEGMIEGVPYAKYDENVLPWEQKEWIAVKPGRYFRSISSGYPDSFYEELNNMYVADFGPLEGEFRIVTGEDIRYWYHDRNINKDELRRGAQSCMTHEECQPFLELYTQNENIRMLVFTRRKKLIGRALLWDLTDGRTLMDRVYGRQVMQKVFESYANEQGWIRKVTHTYGDTPYVIGDTPVEDDNFVVALEKTEFRHYPYMDTMRYVSHDGFVTNKRTDTSDVLAVYTGGAGDNLHRQVACPNCTKRFERRYTGRPNPADKLWYHDYCGTCRGVLFFGCMVCGETKRTSDRCQEKVNVCKECEAHASRCEQKGCETIVQGSGSRWCREHTPAMPKPRFRTTVSSSGTGGSYNYFTMGTTYAPDDFYRTELNRMLTRERQRLARDMERGIADFTVTINGAPVEQLDEAPSAE